MLRQCNVGALGELFSAAWFTGVWVLQEFMLAQNVEFFMGQESFDSYAVFKLACDALKTHEGSFPRHTYCHCPNDVSPGSFICTHDYLRYFELVHGMIYARSLRHAELFGALHPMHPGQSSSMSLYQWCRMLGDRKCTEERDRIYAALGLATDTLATLPDYNPTSEEVFLDPTTKTLLAGDLSPLHDAPTPTVFSPRHIGFSFASSLHPEHRQNQPSPLGGYQTRRYSAGLSRPCLVNLLESPSVNICSLAVDEIYWVDGFINFLDDLIIGRGTAFKPQLELAYTRAISPCGRTFVASASSPLQYADSKLAFWRTINLGFSPHLEDTPYYDTGLDFRFLDLPYRNNIKRNFKTVCSSRPRWAMWAWVRS
jgi:hypothetical protein